MSLVPIFNWTLQSPDTTVWTPSISTTGIITWTSGGPLLTSTPPVFQGYFTNLVWVPSISNTGVVTITQDLASGQFLAALRDSAFQDWYFSVSTYGLIQVGGPIVPYTPPWRTIDYGIYDDGDIYEGDLNIVNFIANQEGHAHHVGVRISYTAIIIPGAGEAFRIHHIEPRNAQDRQGSFTHEAFIDRVRFSGHLAAVIKHSGSELIISHIQVTGQRKKHQPIG